MNEDKSLAVTLHIEQIILTIRGHRVILDSDLAAIYGVTTKALNQAVKRNADRFPADFAFQLAQKEIANLRSHFVTSSSDGIRSQLVIAYDNEKNRSQFVTGSQKHRIHGSVLMFSPNTAR